MGDTHGAAKAFIQCLERAGFEPDVDELIILGDICDGWSDVHDLVEEILKIKNRVVLLGNHDEWFLGFLRTGVHTVEWAMGGKATRDSYLRAIDKEGMSFGNMTALIPEDIPESHRAFFREMIPYHTIRTEKEHLCFVHGGFDLDYSIDTHYFMSLIWDRNLWQLALNNSEKRPLKNVDDFNRIFIGHTHVDSWRNPEALPMTANIVTNLDTGAGWSGKLTIMDIETREYWQSDFVNKLYPDEKGRRG